jgi:hypothetical protein
LKPTTEERDRLKSNIVQSRDVASTINESDNGIKDQLPVDTQGEQTGEAEYTQNRGPNIQHTSEPESLIADMTSCDDCGLMFENVHDLQSHVKKWCPEKEGVEERPMKRKHDDTISVIPSKRPKLEHTLQVSDSKEQEVFDKLIKLSKKANEELWQDKFDKYEKLGLSKTDAEEKADLKLQSS